MVKQITPSGTSGRVFGFVTIGFNVGPVALAGEAPLVAAVNAAIGEMLAQGELPALARAAGLTYLPPREPNISGTITPARLRGD